MMTYGGSVVFKVASPAKHTMFWMCGSIVRPDVLSANFRALMCRLFWWMGFWKVRFVPFLKVWVHFGDSTSPNIQPDMFLVSMT